MIKFIEDFECDDDELVTGYDWIRGFLSTKDWMTKKDNIENCLLEKLRPVDPSKNIAESKRLLIEDDKIGWYLYLAYTYIYERHKYNYFSGARVLPIFKQIGKYINVVKNIPGIDKKIRDMLRKRPNEADAILFEILTALLWSRNGYSVEIINENQGALGKNPDFLAIKGDESWEVECKRLGPSEYTGRETVKKLKMINEVKDLLTKNNILLYVDIHTEVFNLSDSFLKDQLEDLILTIEYEEKHLALPEADLRISKIDVGKINNHLKTHFVKNHSPQLLELIAGKPVDHQGFTCGLDAKFQYVEGNLLSQYLDKVRNVFGLYFNCDAQESIAAKAKDAGRLIKKAIKQFHGVTGGVIHVGIETMDGPLVEKMRTEKVLKTWEHLDTNETALSWIFYHYFQSYSRSYSEWSFDETVNSATNLVYPENPIPIHFLVVPEEEVTIVDGSHWEREAP